MDLQFHGANCVTLSSKQLRVTIDDNLVDLGAKSVTKAGDIVLFTSAHAAPAPTAKLVIDQAGEYEVSGVAIYGIAARSHLDEEGQKNATMYKIIVDDAHILVAGHVYPELTDEQLESIGMIDVMIVPVGGNGYTLDGVGALKLIKKIEPKLIVPTHYDNPNLQFPVPQQSLEEALKALGMEPKENLEKLRLKAGEAGATAQLVVLE